MLKIGGIWNKISKNNKRYQAIVLDKTLLKLYPQLQGVNFVAFYVPETERKSDKAPDYTLYIDEVTPKPQNDQSNENIVQYEDMTDEEIPF